MMAYKEPPLKGSAWPAGSCLESLSLDMVMTAYKASGREGLVNAARFRDFLKLLSCLLPESDCSAH